MERLVRHLWNRNHGSSFRRDLWLYEVDDGWKVAMRQGQGEPVENVFAKEEEAVEMFESIRDDSGSTWKEMTPAALRQRSDAE